MKLCLLNFVCYGLSTGADVFAITQTWFTDKDMAHRAEITLPGYKILDHSRTERSGGGTALLFRDNITVHKVDGSDVAPINFSMNSLHIWSL